MRFQFLSFGQISGYLKTKGQQWRRNKASSYYCQSKESGRPIKLIAPISGKPPYIVLTSLGNATTGWHGSV
jgi:hypothetical protein